MFKADSGWNSSYPDTSIIDCKTNCRGVCCRAWRSCFNRTDINVEYPASISLPYTVCGGESSCESTQGKIVIGRDGGWLICSGSNSCANNYVKVTGSKQVDIYCFGENSCVNTTMNVTTTIVNSTVYCTGGGYPCHGSKIVKMANVYLLSGGYVDEDDMDYEPKTLYIESGGAGEMHVYFRGYKSGRNTIVNCTSIDTCYIHCSVSGACDDSTVIECGESSSCYETIGYTPTNYPTSIPTEATSEPSAQPTMIPSMRPTEIPTATTAVPTAQPTEMPTAAPTNQTSEPTELPTILPTSNPTIANDTNSKAGG